MTPPISDQHGQSFKRSKETAGFEAERSRYGLALVCSAAIQSDTSQGFEVSRRQHTKCGKVKDSKKAVRIDGDIYLSQR